MIKRNGMCPTCYAKLLLQPGDPNKNVPILYNNKPYDNGLALTPPMGWSTWNTFAYRIDQEMIVEMAKVMKEKGLVDAGYVYMNIDDCWEAKQRNIRNELESDAVTFPDGIKKLAERVNACGMKLGIYSSNGTLTCEDYPASLGFEYLDAYTFAKWGVEYWKLDYCHHKEITRYAPLVGGIAVGKRGERGTLYKAEEATLSGNANVFKTRFVHRSDKKNVFSTHISGLDRGLGSAEYMHAVEEDGEYIVSVYVHEVKNYEKFFVIVINDDVAYPVYVPEGIRQNEYVFPIPVQLVRGVNKIKILNPILNGATSDMFQYQHAGQCIKQATADYARDHGVPEKPIVFSLCEWGSGKPYLWGASAGNLWRTTGDIRAEWKSMVTIYEHNVKLYNYANPGHWNDPDMLEVGVGDMKYNESEAHFALWCMMAAPLILGNDIRVMSPEICALIKNGDLISINQDKLGRQAKRIKEGDIDVLVKPLTGGKTALCIFNKTDKQRKYEVKEEDLAKENYIEYNASPVARDAIAKKTIPSALVWKGNVAARSTKVFILG